MVYLTALLYTITGLTKDKSNGRQITRNFKAVDSSRTDIPLRLGWDGGPGNKLVQCTQYLKDIVHVVCKAPSLT